LFFFSFFLFLFLPGCNGGNTIASISTTGVVTTLVSLANIAYGVQLDLAGFLYVSTYGDGKKTSHKQVV
jgi:hypothetical protein